MTRIPNVQVGLRHLNLSILAAAFLLASSIAAQTAGKDPSVTPVEGDSWLRHIHRAFHDTNMGKTWVLGPPPTSTGEALPQWQLELPPRSSAQIVTLHGSDLYRLNCQGCHGVSGLGAPPEINSVINPVRATSVAVVMERTRKTGQDVSRADASVLAREAKVLLLKRLHTGGESMPPFPQLSEPEIQSIIAYLEQLSDVPGAVGRQLAIRESNYRIGELVVKSTCHICHSATGPNPDPQQLMDGAIPPLNTLVERTSLSDLVRKVTHGATIVMGQPPVSYQESYRGRMPVFDYLSQEEAVDAYFYLVAYPPRKN